MILIILESLIIKGGIAIGHWFAAHGTSAMVAKGGTLIAKSIATQGLAQTAAGVTGVAVASSLVVGGYLWTTNHVRTFEEALNALVAQDYITFCKKCAKLSTLFNVHVDLLPDIVQKYMINIGFSDEIISYVKQVIVGSENEILEFMTRKK
jgi:hypothetical protein